MGHAQGTTKVTFSLPAELVRQLRDVVQSGVSPSQNAFVREALERELKRERDAQFATAMEEAARDPLFMRDLGECMSDFERADAATASLIPADEEFDVEP